MNHRNDDIVSICLGTGLACGPVTCDAEEQGTPVVLCLAGPVQVRGATVEVSECELLDEGTSVASVFGIHLVVHNVAI